MFKLTPINVVGTIALAFVLASSPIAATIAASTVGVVSASEINIAPLLGMNRAQLAALYPALTENELDKLVSRIWDQLSWAEVR